MTTNKTQNFSLSNNENRKFFLNSYRDWCAPWLSTPELDLVYYKFELPTGEIIIAEEHKVKIFKGYNKGYEIITGVRYYFKEPDQPLSYNTACGLEYAAEMLKGINLNIRHYQ